MPAIPNIMGGWGRAPVGSPTFPSYLSQQSADFLSGLQPNPTADLSGQAFQPYSWNTSTSQGQIMAPPAGSLSSAYILANGVDTAPGWQERMYAWGKANLDRLPEAAKRSVETHFATGTSPTIPPTETPPPAPTAIWMGTGFHPPAPSLGNQTVPPPAVLDPRGLYYSGEITPGSAQTGDINTTGKTITFAAPTGMGMPGVSIRPGQSIPGFFLKRWYEGKYTVQEPGRWQNPTAQSGQPPSIVAPQPQIQPQNTPQTYPTANQTINQPPVSRTAWMSLGPPISGSPKSTVANPFQIMQQAQAAATPQFPNYTPFQFNRQLPTRPEAWDLNRKQKPYFQT